MTWFSLLWSSLPLTQSCHESLFICTGLCDAGVLYKWNIWNIICAYWLLLFLLCVFSPGMSCRAFGAVFKWWIYMTLLGFRICFRVFYIISRKSTLWIVCDFVWLPLKFVYPSCEKVQKIKRNHKINGLDLLFSVVYIISLFNYRIKKEII